MLNRVKELRKEKGLTQQKLAQEVGISRSAIAMYETGECDPSSEMLKTLSIFFDVSTDYVLCLTDIRKAPTPEEVSAMPEAQELRRRYGEPITRRSAAGACVWPRPCSDRANARREEIKADGNSDCAASTMSSSYSFICRPPKNRTSVCFLIIHHMSGFGKGQCKIL